MNKNIQDFAWGKMNALLDKEMPTGKKQPTKWIGLAILLLFAALASSLSYYLGTQNNTQNVLQGLHSSQEAEYSILRSELANLQDQLEKKDQLLNELVKKQNTGSDPQVVHKTKIIEVPYFIRSVSNFELPSFKHEPIGISAMKAISSSQNDTDQNELSVLETLTDLSVEWIEETPDATLLPVIDRKQETLLQKVKPAFFGDVGYTRTTQSGESGIEASVGATFFPQNRLSLFLGAGVMNQKTPIFNQTTAAKASWQRGFTTLGIASEVKEEAVSYSNYGFLNLTAGMSFQASPKFKFLTAVKGSYILDKFEFSEASIETSERTIRVTETLDDLVEENQVHRWGFSGVVGAEYELTEKIGIQLSYNKFITPLVSSLPIQFQDNEVNLSDFGKLAVSYNF